MRHFMTGFALIGTATNSITQALADGKATVRELTHTASAVLKQAAAMTGKGHKVLVTVPVDAVGSAEDAGERVKNAVFAAIKDGNLDVNDAIDLADVVLAEVYEATGIGDKVVID